RLHPQNIKNLILRYVKQRESIKFDVSHPIFMLEQMSIKCHFQFEPIKLKE
ncbi:MAG: hypothetical protein RIR11_4272, partial [Bacteroidota bacterium]